MEGTPAGLAQQLLRARESDYVRLTAAWLSRAVDWHPEPETTGNPQLDALVASAAAHRAILEGQTPPRWTGNRKLDTYWHPGLPAMFAWSFAHTPIAFKQRGVVVESDSLGSV